MSNKRERELFDPEYLGYYPSLETPTEPELPEEFRYTDPDALEDTRKISGNYVAAVLDCCDNFDDAVKVMKFFEISTARFKFIEENSGEIRYLVSNLSEEVLLQISIDSYYNFIIKDDVIVGVDFNGDCSDEEIVRGRLGSFTEHSTVDSKGVRGLNFI